jgi:hypothetical protein
MLNILTESINRNIDYYTSEAAGAEFILHLRSEIEHAKSRPNETWFNHDQYIPILIFYLKYALSGTAIPRNIMINADVMISQANLKETGLLLAGTSRFVRFIIQSNIEYNSDKLLSTIIMFGDRFDRKVDTTIFSIDFYVFTFFSFNLFLFMLSLLSFVHYFLLKVTIMLHRYYRLSRPI